MMTENVHGTEHDRSRNIIKRTDTDEHVRIGELDHDIKVGYVHDFQFGHGDDNVYEQTFTLTFEVLNTESSPASPNSTPVKLRHVDYSDARVIPSAKRYETKGRWIPWIIRNFKHDIINDLQRGVSEAKDWVIRHKDKIRTMNDIPRELAHVLFQPGGLLVPSFDYNDGKTAPTEA